MDNFRDFLNEIGAKLDALPDAPSDVQPNQAKKPSDIGLEKDRVDFIVSMTGADRNKVISKINEFNTLTIREQLIHNLHGVYKILEFIDDDRDFERFNELVTGLGNILVAFHPEIIAKVKAMLLQQKNQG